jgi:hypothetical protein
MQRSSLRLPGELSTGRVLQEEDESIRSRCRDAITEPHGVQLHNP